MNLQIPTGQRDKQVHRVTSLLVNLLKYVLFVILTCVLIMCMCGDTTLTILNLMQAESIVHSFKHLIVSDYCRSWSSVSLSDPSGTDICSVASLFSRHTFFPECAYVEYCYLGTISLTSGLYKRKNVRIWHTDSTYFLGNRIEVKMILTRVLTELVVKRQRQKR